MTPHSETYPARPGAAEVEPLIRRWTEAMNAQKDAAYVDEYIAPDYVWHLSGRDVRGRDAVKAAFVQQGAFF